MQSLLIERCARRCRELMSGARNAAVVEQLRLWLEELELQMEALTRAADDQAPRLPT